MMRKRGQTKFLDRFLPWAAWGYLLVICMGWVVLYEGDDWWLATVFLFGPRWPVFVPIVLLAIPVSLCSRPLFFPLAVGALIALGPLMGFSIPSVSSVVRAGHDPSSLRIRVLTQNHEAAPIDAPRFREMIEMLKPDIVAMQECGTPHEQTVSPIPNFYFHVHYGLCLLSRFPIRKADPFDRSDVWKIGGSGAIVLYDLDFHGITISLLNLQLETPREGLDALQHSRWKGIPEMEANIRLRQWESKLAQQWSLRARGPILIMGDFNMPVESDIYRTFWSSFTNVYSDVGFGYGFTKQLKYWGTRIDHILAGPGWVPESVRVIPDVGSDHLGVVAELRLAP